MYSDLWSPTLRQGDILGPLPVPLVGKQLDVVSKFDDLSAQTGGPPVQMLVPAARRYVAVLSHDCEFNEGKRDRLLLARVGEVDKRLDADAIAELRVSNDVEGRHAAKKSVDGVDSFVLDPLDGVFDSPKLIVFTTTTPWPAAAQMIRKLQAAKVAELEHEHRLLLRRKLAWFFLRSPDDVPQGDKRPKEAIAAGFREALG